MRAPSLRFRVGWTLFGACLLFSVASVVLTVLDIRSVPGYHSIEEPGYVAAVTYGAVGAVIVSRRPRNAIGWIFLADGFISGLTALSTTYFAYAYLRHPDWPFLSTTAWLQNALLALLVPGFYVVFLLFPTGRLPSSRWRPVLALAIVATAGLTLVAVLAPEVRPYVFSDTAVSNPTGIGGLPFRGQLNWAPTIPFRLAVIIACVSAIPFRWRGARGEERQQVKYVAYAALVMITGYATGLVVSVLAGVTQAHVVLPLTTFAGLEIAVPVACGLAILRYRLFDIDLVIRRTLVYGALAAFVTGVYAAVVVGVGELVGTAGKPNLWLSILASAVVAVAFQPARERVQRIANRLVYGKRATPYEVLSEFSEQLSDAYANEEVLSRMAHILSEGAVADSVDIWLRIGSELRIAASWPDADRTAEPLRLHGDTVPPLADATVAVPVKHRGELLGALAVRKRVGEPLTPIEAKLVEDLARQAGLVLRNVRLTEELLARLEDLRTSRQRLVTAQDVERRRLERNLHDGAQQHLVALRFHAALAENLLEREPQKAKPVLAQLKSDATAALETVRELAHGLYPPILADSGLEIALSAQAQRSPVPTTVRAHGLRRYPPELEGTVYFCCLEALQNVAKYAQASGAEVVLEERDGALLFAVRDDGVGFDLNTGRRGAGLQNMADRVEALGGTLELRSASGQGTMVTARLPLVVAAGDERGRVPAGQAGAGLI